MTFSKLGTDTDTGHIVELPQASRRQGLYIIGANGTGKTGLIENLILQDIDQGLGVGLLDPHGDLTNAILTKMTKREDDVILLDIQDEDHPFGVNIFECPNPQSPTAVQKIVDLVMHIFEKLYDVSRQTPRMAQFLRNCTHTLVANPGYTMADIPLLLQDEQCRSKLVTQVKDPQVQLFWKTYNALKPSEQFDRAESTINKMDELLQPLPRNIVGQGKTTVNIQQVMDERKILLVKLSAQLDQVTSLVGTLIIALFLNAAYSRTVLPVNKRRQFNLYADEFQRFATEDFATLLTESRKFGIATTIAHQARYQPGMTDGIRATSLSAANLVVFKVSSKDAAELAGEFDITPAPERVEEIEKEELIGQRPVRTYKHDVVGHLLHQSSEDERIADFVKKYLQELHLASLEKIERRREAVDYTGGKHGYVSYRDKIIYPRNHLGIEYNPEEIPAVLVELNEWLFEGMKNSDALWQPLPYFTFYYLADFFDFKAVYDVLYYNKYFGGGDPLLSLIKYGLTDEEYANSGFGRGELINTKVAALEDALVDFLSTLFPNRSRADIRDAWQQKAIDLPSCAFSDIRTRSHSALERITDVVRKDTHAHPDLDVAAYKRRFILELSRPEHALDVFLPAVLHYQGSGHQILNCRVPHREYVYLPYHKGEMKVTYTYSLALLKPDLHQAIMEELPKFIEPFQTYVGFCADLHCAQLALSQ